MVNLNLGDNDIRWLEAFFPSLQYDPERSRIVGELGFCACYDVSEDRVLIEGLARDGGIRSSLYLICDVFDVEIRLDESSVGSKSWPAVYEKGGRWQAIAERNNVEHFDLHIDSGGGCCLGIRWSEERKLSLERFIYFIVVPFFYRLAYVDVRGIEAAKQDLWGEYSHGDAGFEEHGMPMLKIRSQNLGRNDRCACGSGKKFKHCCFDEVQKINDLLS